MIPAAWCRGFICAALFVSLALPSQAQAPLGAPRTPPPPSDNSSRGPPGATELPPDQGPPSPSPVQDPAAQNAEGDNTAAPPGPSPGSVSPGEPRGPQDQGAADQPADIAGGGGEAANPSGASAAGTANAKGSATTGPGTTTTASGSDIAQSVPALQKLTEFRPRHRKTIDGRLCAAAFVHEGQTYTDCTDARSPDGTTGREWCYVEVQLLGKGPKDWDFCTPPLNYNALRSFVRREFDALMATNDEMIDSLDVEELRLQDMLSRFRQTCGPAHTALKQTVGQIESRLKRGTQCLKRLEASLKEVGLIESAIEDVRTDIEREGAKSLKDPENCQVKPGYEDDPQPDGLRGAYFANDRFQWPPKKYRTDRKVDFLFFGDGPIDEVPSHAYSIQTDCGVRVFLNERPVIVDRMPPPTKDDAFGHKAVPLMAAEEQSGVHAKDSEKVELIAGEKYRIRIELVHSNHLKYHNPETAVLRLLWRSGAAEPEVIPEEFFFTTSASPTAKFLGVNPKMFDSDFLQNGVQPFLDNKSYFITDIPLRYHGRRMLRSLAQPNIDSFTIDLNVPAILYIASPADESLPLEPTNDAPWTAHETHETMTLLSGVDASGRALEAKPLSIRFISLRTAGGVKCKVRHTAIPFIIFVEPHKEEAFSCDAEEDVVSLVGGPAFAECDATSEQPDGFDCFSGLNGKHMDRPFGTWKTKGGGVGESITVRFRHLVQLTHFRFKPLDDQLLWPSEVTLSYSEEGDEGSETFLMRHSNSLEHNTYKLRAPVITQYVKAEISQMYVNGMESGGSFEFLGSICTTQVRAKGISSLRKILIEKCDQSLEAIPEVVPLEEGLQFIAICPHHCVASPEGRVFGSSSFAPESTVCASGVFAGICKAEVQAECSLLVTVGGAKNTFSKDTKHYIEAAEHGPSDASYTLAKAPCEGKEEEQPSYFFTFGAQSAPEGWLIDDGSARRVRNGAEYGMYNVWCGALIRVFHEDWPKPNSGVWSRVSLAFKLRLSAWRGKVLVSAKKKFSPSHAERALQDCTPNFWSLAVAANGIYHIEALLAVPFDSAYDSAPLYLEVNGVPIANGTVISKGKIFGGSATVEVTQRLIDFASVCKNATCGAEPTLLLSASVSYVGPLPGNSETEED
ncbi:uncharacterized protein LOC34618352 [Cyclospora cayetanensis]|uniref:Uncharacterized protein LOC34618352 n=1 Tax=Cyclospora cayetanensis TaxID=88456 RepID=A0A6P6S2B4_9EIME|nr:uncharacterized protein LOC34618352 [Cyclospora cayetanensis]